MIDNIVIPKDLKHRVSDGYHTFSELYMHRHLLTLALMRAMPGISWYSNKHSDGTMFDDSFIVGVDLPQGRVTYHLPCSLRRSAWATGARFVDKAPEWDGHTSNDVVERLRAFAEGHDET